MALEGPRGEPVTALLESRRASDLSVLHVFDARGRRIHEELLEANPLSPTEALLWLRERIAAGIRYLLDVDREEVDIILDSRH